MCTSNLQIVTGLKEFLMKAAQNREVYCSKPSDFSRATVLTFPRVALALTNMMKRSLAVELADFFGVLGADDQLCTKSAFSQARQKLKPVFFEDWNQYLCQRFYQNNDQDLRRWNNFRLQGVDGTFINLVNNEQMQSYFGLHKNQYSGTCLAKAVVRYDVLNQIAVDAKIGPESKSENAYALQSLDQVEQDVISIYDRNFPSYDFIYEHHIRGLHYLMRCKINQNSVVKKFVASGANSQIVNFKISKNALISLANKGYEVTKTDCLQLRLVRVDLPSGQVEVLATSLLDPCYTPIHFQHLYHQRWGSETFFDRFKNQLQIENFSGHTVLSVFQEFYALIFVHNLQSIIIEECQEQVQQICSRRTKPYKVNRNVTLGLLKNRIVLLFVSEHPYIIWQELKTRFVSHLEQVKPNRHYPHKYKQLNRRGKFRTQQNYRRAI